MCFSYGLFPCTIVSGCDPDAVILINKLQCISQTAHHISALSKPSTTSKLLHLIGLISSPTKL